MENTCNLFEGMPVAEDEDNHVFMEGLIFEGGDHGIPYDPDETQSQDGSGTHLVKACPTPSFWQKVHHEFHERKKFKPYQMKSKHGWVSLGKRWRVIQQECNKIYSTLKSIEACPVSGIDMKDMVFQALEAFKVHYEGKSFNLTNCWMIINGEENFKAQYAAIMARGGTKAIEEHGEGRSCGCVGRPTPRKTTSARQRPLPLLCKA
ncbi:Lectin-domain containing receptor kinase A4.3 [Hordeum vulgare]|nr:Lectin-domain containing receptor kinase A4.3 [Hordeum vulgare]